MSASSSDIAILFIDLAELPLASLVSTVAEELEDMGDVLFSIYVISDTDDHPISDVLEGIALCAIISLLREYVHQIEELLVQTEYRSSLWGIWALVEALGPSVADRTALYYRVNDV